MLRFLHKIGLVKPKNKDGYTPLARAIWYNDPDTAASEVITLIERNADVNQPYRDGERLLNLAARIGHEKVVRILLENRARVNEQDKKGYTALMHAFKPNSNIAASLKSALPLRSHPTINTQVIRLLLENKADVNMTTPGEDPALIQAARKDHCRDTAIRKDNFNLVKWILEYKADVNKPGEEKNTALMCAASPEIVKLLLDNKANINQKNYFRDTALTLLAVNMRAIDQDISIKILLENKADVNHKNSRGNTALLSCISEMPSPYGDSTTIFTIINSLLKSSEIDLEIQKEGGKTALEDLMSYNLKGYGDYYKELLQLKLACLLINHGAKTENLQKDDKNKIVREINTEVIKNTTEGFEQPALSFFTPKELVDIIADYNCIPELEEKEQNKPTKMTRK